jgi:hypothetical protein
MGRRQEVANAGGQDYVGGKVALLLQLQPKAPVLLLQPLCQPTQGNYSEIL